MLYCHRSCVWKYLVLWIEAKISFLSYFRWAREGTIPLYNISEILPDEMKFSFSDRLILSTNLHHQSHSFLYECFTVSRVLKMDFKISKSLCKILTASLVFDLGFPSNCYCCAITLFVKISICSTLLLNIFHVIVRENHLIIRNDTLWIQKILLFRIVLNQLKKQMKFWLWICKGCK